jgi:hypothetical protein
MMDKYPRFKAFLLPFGGLDLIGSFSSFALRRQRPGVRIPSGAPLRSWLFENGSNPRGSLSWRWF